MTCSYVIIAECTSQSKASTCVRRSEENRGELEAPSERWRSYVAFFFPSLSFPPRPAALSSTPGSDGHDLTPHPTQSHCTTRHASKLDNASLAPSTAPLARLRCVARGARAPAASVGRRWLQSSSPAPTRVTVTAVQQRQPRNSFIPRTDDDRDRDASMSFACSSKIGEIALGDF